jgi:hypothetical protein
MYSLSRHTPLDVSVLALKSEARVAKEAIIMIQSSIQLS